MLDRAFVSRLHARIELQHERYVLVDAGSSNGTFVNGQRLRSSHRLTTGDEIWLGSSKAALQFTDPEETLNIPAATPPPALLIDEQARSVAVHGTPTLLSPLEYRLLVYLAHNAGAVCTREESFLHVWGQPYDPATCEDALNACIAKLRRNLRVSAETTGHEPPLITTVPRIGLRLDEAVVFASR